MRGNTMGKLTNLPLMSSVIETIGNTPLVELRQLSKVLNLSGKLLAKLEFFNPGFSKKDRVALEMIQTARKEGLLKPGQTVVELTSGNTGTGLAIVCRAIGHPFIAVMSRGNTIERAQMMRALGAEVVLVDQASGSQPQQVSGADLELVELETKRLVTKHGAFRANQFELISNMLAHERYTGPELWEQSKGAIEVFVDFVGSAGSFTGVTRYLRKKSPDIRAYVVEPAGGAALSRKVVSQISHKIQGGGYGMSHLSLLEKNLVTDYLEVHDQEAIEATQLLASEEGIFGGFSTGANLAAAIHLLRTKEVGATIGFLVCDSGLKYLSTTLFSTQEN